MIKQKKDTELGKNKFFLINDGKKQLENLDDNQPSESERQNTEENQTTSNNDESKNNADAPFIMTIEVEEGRNDKIYIYFDSTAEELAYDFCKKNNLDFSSLRYLTDEIGKLIKKLHDKKNADVIQEVDEEDKISEINKSKSSTKKVPEVFINESISKKKKIDDDSKLLINNSYVLKESKINQKDFNLNNVNTNNSLAISTMSRDKNSARNCEEIIIKEPLMNNLKDSKFNNFIKTEENEKNSLNVISQPEYLQTKELFDNNATNNKNNKLYEYQLYLKQVISKESRKKLSRNSNNSKDSIFNKLYNDSKLRKNKKVSMTEEISTLTMSKNTKSNQRAKSPNLNVIINNNNNIYNTVNKFNSPINKELNKGEILYYKGVASKDDKIRKVSQKRVEKEKELNKYCTFKPISEKAKKEKIVVLLYLIKPTDSINKRMNNIISNTHSKNHHSRNFSPGGNKRVDNNLREYLTETRFKGDRNLELMELSSNTKSKIPKNLYQNDYINKRNGSPDLALTENSKKSKFLNDFFIETNEIERKKSEKYLKTKHQFGQLEKVSGQELFLSVKSKSNEKIRNNSSQKKNNEFIDKLSGEAKFKRIMNARAENIIKDNFKKNSNIIHTINSTDVLYNKKKIEQFEKIFQLMDQDEDGSISSINLTLKNIPQQLIRIINPIITLLKEDNVRLNLIEFIKECEYLFENLTHLEKKDLINFDKFYEFSYGFNWNNRDFIQKILNKKKSKNKISKQKSNSTISVDKSIKSSQIINNLNTASNEGSNKLNN